jgi:hypothetical protein
MRTTSYNSTYRQAGVSSPLDPFGVKIATFAKPENVMRHVKRPTRMNLTIYIFGLFLLTSCGRGYELSELYIQEIENSDKTIIEYGAWSTLNDGAKYGTTILDKNESIEIKDAEQMSFSFLIGNPTKDTLFVIGLKEGGSRIPKYISTEISKFKGMIINTDLYSYEIGTSHNLTYKFSSFKETRDSLIISGIEKDFFNLPNDKNEIGFLKGNIKLIESDSLKGILRQIEIPTFLLRNINKTNIDKVTIIRNDSLQIDGMVYFTFEPTRQIKTGDFSNFGIFKKREIKNVKMVQ